MIARIRRARLFLHASHATSWLEVGRFRQTAQRFIQRFGEPWELAKFDEAWHATFFLPPLEDRKWKAKADAGEVDPAEVPFYHPALVRQALFVVISILKRVKGDSETNVPFARAVLPHTKREKFFRSRMATKGLRTFEALARQAGVNKSDVSRAIRKRASTRRKLSASRIKIYSVLGIADETEIPLS